MRIYDADIRQIATPAALQVYLGFVLKAPSYYGHNLDALYDILTERSQPACLVLRTPAGFSPEMQAYWPRLVQVLDDAAKANPAFSWREEK